jgi:hypothetical protein
LEISDRYIFRELLHPGEIVTMLRLRHRIYFEENGYGVSKPLGLDLTAHDACSRLFGVFCDGSLLGGVRVVYRTAQASAMVFDALHAVVDAPAPLTASSLLPSEEAFDLASVPGIVPKDVHAELGRFALERTAAVPWLAQRTIRSVVAALHAEHCPLYMYSCAKAVAKRYARVTNPCWTLQQCRTDGIRSDNFVFPKPTIAAVARPGDATENDVLRDYVLQLRRTGMIVLNPEQPVAHQSQSR